MTEHVQLAVVGSGFAGTILARIARRLGVDVTLLERGRHPRFALGESSTPLGNLALRRLGRRYGLEDLENLSSYGRWIAAHPQVRRGLKRGFTFYAHRPGRPFEAGPANRHRLLVAASPDDRVADTHWLRSDVDGFLARRAADEGVDLRLETEVTAVRASGERFRLTGRTAAGSGFALDADLAVDATGAAGAFARLLPIEPRRPGPEPRSRLVYGHLAGLTPFVDAVPGGRSSLEPGPYPDDRAAVHHLLDGGWLYVLPFDHDCASVGWVRVGAAGEGDGSEPAEELAALVGRYPSLAAQFAAARPLGPVRSIARIQHRRQRAAGSNWALLPHAYAFFDPIFSTGIAWSLIGVERLARLLEESPPGGAGWAAARRTVLRRYAERLAREADRIERLVADAYLALARPPLLFDLSMLYFAAVSWAEIRQRIEPEAAESAAWEGFLGVGDPRVDHFFLEGSRRLRAELAGGGGEGALSSWVGDAIAERNLVGLADPERRNLYPADLEVVIERGGLLGRSRGEMRGLAPRLLDA